MSGKIQTIDDWVDPNPTPVIQEISPNVFVVRDDLLGYGSKARFIDYLIGHSPLFKDKKEIVFGSAPATGWAQISGPVVCKRYDKKFVCFMAARDPKRYTFEQKLGIQLGTEYHWVKDGMLNVTTARAREYAEADPINRAVLPIGLEHPTVIESIVKVARSLPIVPDIVWSVGSSGTLNRGLQLAWPEAEVHVVQVGHNMKPHEIGRAKLHKSSYKFDKPVKPNDAPPYPSVATYDAKVWRPFVDYYEHNVFGFYPDPGKKILLWNVA